MWCSNGSGSENKKDRKIQVPTLRAYSCLENCRNMTEEKKTLKAKIQSLKEMYNRIFENENRSSEWYDNLLAIVHCQINDLDSSVAGLVLIGEKEVAKP